MEKINALIDKLQELKNSNAGLQIIAYHAQLLQSEVLRAQLASPDAYTSTSSNIAVILPASRAQAAIAEPVPASKSAAAVVAPAAIHTEHSSAAATVVMPAAKATNGSTAATPAIPPAHEKWTGPAQTDAPAPEKPVVVAAEVPHGPTAPPDTAPHSAPGVIPPASPVFREMQPEKPSERAFITVTAADLDPTPETPKKPSPLLQETEAHGPVPASRPKTIIGKNGVPGNTLFDTPTPTQETSGIRNELHELAGKNMASLNDRLRSTKIELGEQLGDTRVSDLRHAIGINDKFQFIQELFRGDVDMYERSVRTINEFRSFQEADLWIQRELKIKLGWQDDHGPVQHFYGLLKKRFS